VKVYERYFFREIALSYIFFLFVFNFLFLIIKFIDFTDKIVNGVLPFTSTLKLLFLLLPSFGIFTIPLVTLSAILYSFSRFSSSNEIIALKSFGIANITLYKIPFIIGIFSFLIGIFNNIYLLPLSTKHFLYEANDIIKNKNINTLQPKTFNNPFGSTVIYFGDFIDGKKVLQDIIIYDEFTNIPEIITAEEGIITEKSNIFQLKLKNGAIHIKKSKKNYEVIIFKDYILSFDLKESLNQTINIKDKESSIDELNKRIANYSSQKNIKKVNAIKMEIYKKYSLPFASIIFVIAGVFFGITNSRNPKSWTLFIILSIIFVYYLTIMLSSYMTKFNILIPLLGAWLPNIVVLLLITILMRYIKI